MTATAAQLETIAQPVRQVAETSKTKPGPKPKKLEDTVRYFLAKEGSSVAKPELGEELPNESATLVRAFRAKDSLFYTVTAYQAEADTKGGSPTIVKRPAHK